MLRQIVRENLATLYAAVEQGFASPLPSFVKDELARDFADRDGILR